MHTSYSITTETSITCLTKTLNGTKSTCITGWRAGPARPTHPGVPHASPIISIYACYYSRIMLYTNAVLLFSKLFPHSYRKPNLDHSFVFVFFLVSAFPFYLSQAVSQHPLQPPHYLCFNFLFTSQEMSRIFPEVSGERLHLTVAVPP